MFHSCSKHVLTAATLTCEISKVSEWLPETPCQWFGNLVQVPTHTHESLAQGTILHAPKNWWSIPILILQVQLTWQQFSVEQCEACKQISCVQSSKTTYKNVQELVVNVRIMLIIFFFIAFIDTTRIWTSRILEQFADAIPSISWISNQHSIWSQSVFRGYQPKCIMIWNMHPPKLGDRKYNSLNCSDESEVVDKWWNVILNAARGHPCKGRNKMVHSLLSQSLVLFELQVEYCHNVHFLPLRRTKQMEDSFFQHQTENVHIYWLTSLESKGAAAPRIPCAYLPDLKYGRGYSTQPTTLQALSPHTKYFLHSNNECPFTTRHGETFQHELNGEGFGFRDAEKSFPWFYISCWAGTQGRNMVAHINGIENLLLGLVL